MSQCDTDSYSSKKTVTGLIEATYLWTDWKRSVGVNPIILIWSYVK